MALRQTFVWVCTYGELSIRIVNLELTLVYLCLGLSLHVICVECALDLS